MQNQVKGAGNVSDPLGVHPIHVVTLAEDGAENGTISTKEQCKTIYLSVSRGSNPLKGSDSSPNSAAWGRVKQTGKM